MATFYNEVIGKSEYFNITSRVAAPDLLEPKTREAVQAIIDAAAKEDVTFGLYETYRSRQRQEFLFAQSLVPDRALDAHHFGLAAELVRIVDGSWNWNADHSLLGKLAPKFGLVWNGENRVQRVARDDEAMLLAGAWYPKDDYIPQQPKKPAEEERPDAHAEGA